jgi:hypothetical protein
LIPAAAANVCDDIEACHFNIYDLAGNHLEPPRSPQRADLCFNLRGHAMTQNVPIRAGVAKNLRFCASDMDRQIFWVRGRSASTADRQSSPFAELEGKVAQPSHEL